MIRTASHGELPRIRELLRRANDTPWDLAAVAQEKCFGRGVAGEPRVRIAGEFDGIAVTCGRYLRILAVDPAQRNRGIGSALLADSPARIVAAEPGNYFLPGVLDPSFFAHRGFVETAATVNLSCATTGFTSRCERAGDDVLPFIEQHFGRIWRFECERAAAIFVTRDANGITGFAAIEANNRGLGTFGPTGVHPAHRGRGLGRDLLHTALAALANFGYERAIIPWTDATEFYRRSCGAVVDARFVTMTRPTLAATIAVRPR